MATDVDQHELAQQLLAQAREQGIGLVGPDGLLNRQTKNVLETALEADMEDHLGYEKHDAGGRGSGNSCNGTRTKTVLTEIGPVEIDVPRDTGSTFEPQIIKKRQRRLTGVDEIVLSLSAKGLTTGEIAAHFDDVYGARVSKDTISRIAEGVICSTNAIESLNARYRRSVRARGHFPTEQAALKCLYLATRALDRAGIGRALWAMRWKPALNAFAITFEGRIN
ncbi:transposase [Arthrobacter sp. NPDC080073]|uniref:transposase n=1 Tax=Arthrobacter sp. NPDC080073 TaxID=3155919 RepID=UPI0034147000